MCAPLFFAMQDSKRKTTVFALLHVGLFDFTTTFD